MNPNQKWLFAFLLFFASDSISQAQALPAAEPQKINMAISKTVSDVMIRRGIAANDPIFAKTLTRLSPALSTAGATGAAITIGAVTAPGWVSAALMIGIGIAVQYAIELAIDASVKWFFQPDGTIDYRVNRHTKKAIDALSPKTLAWSGPYYVIEDGQNETWTIMGADLELIEELSLASLMNIGFQLDPDPATCWPPDEFDIAYCDDLVQIERDYPEKECASGEVLLGWDCMSPDLLFPEDAKKLVKAASPQEAIDALPNNVLSKKLHPQIIAALVDQAWKTAADMPGYDGVPYSATSPVTANDVSRSIQENPDIAPTVRDFVAPNPTTSAQPDPWVVPTATTAPDPSPEPTPEPEQKTDSDKETPKIDLGPDPGIGSPTLEAIPTALQIVQPVLDMVTELRGFKVNSHTSTCPRPNFQLFEQTFTLDAHCKLISDNKFPLQAAMSFAWAAFALFIILSA